MPCNGGQSQVMRRGSALRARHGRRTLPRDWSLSRGIVGAATALLLLTLVSVQHSWTPRTPQDNYQRELVAAADAASHPRGHAKTAITEVDRDQSGGQRSLVHGAFIRPRLRSDRVAQQQKSSLRIVTPAGFTTRTGGLALDRLGVPDGSQQWDPTLPMVPSANVARDPLAIVNSILGVATTSASVTADMGRSFLASLGLVPASITGRQGGLTNGVIPRVHGQQASEYVIRRAMSQIGVPYSWGGGSAAGPSRGIDSGSGTVGFDCSGIVLFAFAGVGIKLPHYSGDQYNAGRKVPVALMRRGDVIFYGPNASQHEALYLGQGMMLEAPYTGSDVHVSAVRTAGMTPYVTRFIEY